MMQGAARYLDSDALEHVLERWEGMKGMGGEGDVLRAGGGGRGGR